MSPDEDWIGSVIKGTRTMLRSEDLLVEAVQDLIKDEVKRHIRQKLDADPELREELKQAVAELLEAKIKEAYAVLKIGKCGAKVGLSLVPPELREKIGHELVSMFEKEISQILSQE